MVGLRGFYAPFSVDQRTWAFMSRTDDLDTPTGRALYEFLKFWERYGIFVDSDDITSIVPNLNPQLEKVFTVAVTRMRGLRHRRAGAHFDSIVQSALRGNSPAFDDLTIELLGLTPDSYDDFRSRFPNTVRSIFIPGMPELCPVDRLLQSRTAEGYQQAREKWIKVTESPIDIWNRRVEPLFHHAHIVQVAEPYAFPKFCQLAKNGNPHESGLAIFLTFAARMKNRRARLEIVTSVKNISTKNAFAQRPSGSDFQLRREELSTYCKRIGLANAEIHFVPFTKSPDPMHSRYFLSGDLVINTDRGFDVFENKKRHTPVQFSIARADDEIPRYHGELLSLARKWPAISM